MIVQRDFLYDNCVNLIINYCRLNFQSKYLVISYMYSFFKNQRVLPFKISDQVYWRTYLSDADRPILKVYVVEELTENENVEQEQHDMFNDKLDEVDINILDDESRDKVEKDQEPMPIIMSSTVGSSQSTQLSNL